MKVIVVIAMVLALLQSIVLANWMPYEGAKAIAIAVASFPWCFVLSWTAMNFLVLPLCLLRDDQ